MRAAQAVLIAGCWIAMSPQAFADDLVTINQAAAAAIAAGRNISTINQVGNNNTAETNQLGAQNSAAIGQYGNNNTSVITQTGVGGVVIDNQYGNGNQFRILQTGSRPPPVIITQRR